MSSKLRIALAAVIALLVVLLGVLIFQAVKPAVPVGVPAAQTTTTVEPIDDKPGRRGTIVFDMAHGEVFGPQDNSELGQSALVTLVRAGGYGVTVNTSQITTATFTESVAAIYLPGPMRPLAESEREVVDDFVRRGGTAIITIHVPFPIIGTPARYGLPVGKGVMVFPNEIPTPSGDPGVWATGEITADPLTKGVKQIGVVSGWPLSLSESEIADPRIVVSAPRGVVVDATGDNQFTTEDPQPPYGVIGVASVGSGRVIVMGDDAILANVAIGQLDNTRLLNNILDFIAAPKPV